MTDHPNPVPERHPPLPQRIFGWIRRHKIASSALIALVVTVRFGRWGVAAAWGAGQFLGIERVFDFLVEHWILGLAACGVVFVAAFFAVRLGLDWYDRYEERRQRREAEHAAEAERRKEERELKGSLLDALGPAPADVHRRDREDVPLIDRRPRIG